MKKFAIQAFVFLALVAPIHPAQAITIDFEGFKPLLERIDATILAHSKQRTGGTA